MRAPRLVLALAAAGLTALAAVPPAADPARAEPVAARLSVASLSAPSLPAVGSSAVRSSAVGSSAVANPASTDAVIARYRSRIPELMRAQHVPGLAVALVDGSTVLWQQGFGATDGHGDGRVTADTLFSVQSMSKTFTATAVMAAVQAGRVDLDVPITAYLPGFTVHSAFEQHPERRITLRMLLSCTAGFSHEAPLGNNYTPEVGTFEAHVASISATWLRFPVGTGFAYSNEGFDLAARVLEAVYGEPFPAVVHDLVLGPLRMTRSSFDRATVHSATDRAVGHTGGLSRPRVDSPMTGAGGLWSSAADLARFLSFQLGNGTADGRSVLDPSMLRDMRAVPPSVPGTTAGYALGIARTRWQAAGYADLFTHGGGGEGFLSDLWFAPQVGLGVAVLTNSDGHQLQGSLAMGMMNDLVAGPDGPYAARLRSLPVRAAVLPDGGDFVPPADLVARIRSLTLPSSPEQRRRWAAYPQFYRAGQVGALDPAEPASRFRVRNGVPWFDSGEDGALARHSLTEFRPGLFLTDEGETLDLRAGSRSWRGLSLHPVTNGPLDWQWALLGVTGLVAAGWLLLAGGGLLRARTRQATAATVPMASGRAARSGRVLTASIAVVAVLAALAVLGAIAAIPGLVDVGFLGAMDFPLPVRLAVHIPLLLTLATVTLVALVSTGAYRGWWGTRVHRRDLVLVLALAALCAQLVAWHLVGLAL